MRKFLLFLAAVLLFFLFFSVTSGRFLVVNSPEHSDVIVVLAGETDRRPSRALELYSQGYAGRVLIDVPSTNKIFGFNLLQLAQNYVQSLPQPNSVAICPVFGLSTKAETQDVAQCLQQTRAK